MPSQSSWIVHTGDTNKCEQKFISKCKGITTPDLLFTSFDMGLLIGCYLKLKNLRYHLMSPYGNTGVNFTQAEIAEELLQRENILTRPRQYGKWIDQVQVQD